MRAPKLDPEHRRILAGTFRRNVDTTKTIRAKMVGTTLFMPLETPTQAQAKAALVEIEAELEALHASVRGER